MKKKKKPSPQARKGVFGYKHTYSLLIGLFVFLLYANTLQNDFALDDGIYITNHRAVQKGWGGLADILSQGSTYGFQQQEGQQAYRPIPLLTFAIDKSLFNNNPGLEHAINVLLYALLGLVLFNLLSIWLEGVHPWIVLMIVGFYLAHPVHTEVVANIKSRDELFCFLFGALSLYYLHQWSRGKKSNALLLSLSFFGLSILSKETGLTLLGVIPFALHFFEKESVKQNLFRMLPYVGIVGVYFLIRSLVISGSTDESENQLINNVLNGASDWGEHTATRVALLGEYLRLLVFPHPLSWDYSYPQLPIVGWQAPRAIASLLLHLALLGALIVSFPKRKIYAFCILFYGLTFALTANILFINGSTLGERFLFMPSWGFCIALPLGLAALLKVDTAAFSGKHKNTWLGLMGTLLLLGTVLTIQRNGDWKDNFHLFEAGAKAAPNSARTNGSLAFEYKRQAQLSRDPNQQAFYFPKSEQAFKKSLALYPDYEYSLYNLGVLYLETGALEQAKTYFSKTLAVVPNHFAALNNMGVSYFRQKNYKEAIPYFKHLLELSPNDVQALSNLGASYFNLGEIAQCAPYYEKALALEKKDVNIYDSLIRIYNTLGDPTKAQSYAARKKASFNLSD